MMGIVKSPNLDLIQYFFRLRDRWVLPQAIASDLGGSSEDIHRATEELLREGYGIEYHPSFGYRFRPADDSLDPHRLREGLDTTLIGSEVHCLLEVSSTMDSAWALHEEGRPSGAAVLAERQRKGRGRFGRPWESPRGGGIWMSIILKGEDVPNPPSLLTVASTIAVVEAVAEESGLPSRIRWPNDIVIRDKKVGGILIEMRQQGAKPPPVVIGVGLNVSIRPEELPETLKAIATSITAEGGKGASRPDLIRAVLRSLDVWIRRTLGGDSHQLKTRWRDLCGNLGKRVALLRNEERFEGVVVDCDPIRGLVLDLGAGVVRAFPAEQVTVL